MSNDEPSQCSLRDRGVTNFSRNLAADLTQYLSERPEMNSQEESSWKAKPTRKENYMSQKKAKKTIQVRDLTPLKDVRGGRHHRHRHTSALTQNLDRDFIARGPQGFRQP